MVSATTGGYRILDEIEPVTESSWALHPQLAFYGSMMLPTLWLAVIGALNSFLLGHPRRKHHAAIGIAAMMAIRAIVFVALHYMPEPTWKYCGLVAVAIHLWLGYYFTEEHEWAAEMFQQAGGKIVSFWTTLGILKALSRIFVLRARNAFARLFIGMVR